MAGQALWLSFFSVLIIAFLTTQKTTSYQPFQCMQTGLEILRGRKIVKRLRATFVVNESLAFYQVQFCSQKSWLCFATKIEHVPGDVEDVIRNLSLWYKLIQAITGKSIMSPYNAETHEDTFGGRNEYFTCSDYFIIDGPPENSTIGSTSSSKSIGRRRLHRSCLSGSTCTRTCMHDIDKVNKCHEIKLSCLFRTCSKSKRKTPKGKLRRNISKRKRKMKWYF